MTVDRTREMPDNRMKAAVARGMGLTLAKAADFAGVTPTSLDLWQKLPEFTRVVTIVSACKALDLAGVIQKANLTAETRIRGVFERSLIMTERAIQKVEDLGDEATLATLMDMHAKVTVWASKFAASEAPKRLEVDSQTQVTHRHVLSLPDAMHLMARRGEVSAARAPTALIEGVIDVEPS